MIIFLIPIGVLMVGILTVFLLNRFSGRSGLAWLASLTASILGLVWAVSLYWLPESSLTLPISDLSLEFSIHHQTIFQIILVMSLIVFIIMTVPSRIDTRRQVIVWSDMLILALIGLFTMSAGNAWTVLVGWLALDWFEISLSLAVRGDLEASPQVFRGMISRLIGIGLAIIAVGFGMGTNPSGTSESLAVAAVVFRIGIFPLQNSYLSSLSGIRPGVLVVLKALSVLFTLPFLAGVKVPFIGDALFNTLLIFATFSAFYNSLTWLYPREQTGEQGWEYPLNVASAFLFISAVRSQPEAMIVWASALVFVLIPFQFYSHQNRLLNALMLLNLLLLVGLPGTPFAAGWQGLVMPQLNWTDIFIIFSFVFLLSGLILRLFDTSKRNGQAEETWMHTLVPFGYLLTFLILIVSSMMNRNFFSESGVAWAAVAAFILTGTMTSRLSGFFEEENLSPGKRWVPYLSSRMECFTRSLAALDWLSRPVSGLFGFFSAGMELVNGVFEGYRGVLWEFLLLISLLLVIMR